MRSNALPSPQVDVSNKDYLYVRRGPLVQCQGKLDHRMIYRPVSLQGRSAAATQITRTCSDLLSHIILVLPVCA